MNNGQLLALVEGAVALIEPREGEKIGVKRTLWLQKAAPVVCAARDAEVMRALRAAVSKGATFALGPLLGDSGMCVVALEDHSKGEWRESGGIYPCCAENIREATE